MKNSPLKRGVDSSHYSDEKTGCVKIIAIESQSEIFYGRKSLHLFEKLLDLLRIGGLVRTVMRRS